MLLSIHVSAKTGMSEALDVYVGAYCCLCIAAAIEIITSLIKPEAPSLVNLQAFPSFKANFSPFFLQVQAVIYSRAELKMRSSGREKKGISLGG